MFTESTLVAFVILITLIGISSLNKTHRNINFMWSANIIFAVVIVPKLILYEMIGDSAFVSSAYATFSSVSVNAAALLIFSFIATINVVYLIEGIHPVKSKSYRVSNFSVNSVTHASVVVILPIFLVSYVFFYIFSGISLSDFFSKPELLIDGEITQGYVLQKIVQIVKCAVYLYLLKLLSHGELKRSEMYWLLVFFLLTSLVYMTSGQRSGIFMLIVEIALVLQACKMLKPRLILYFAGFFLAVNFLILSARIAIASTELNLITVLLRRYFFDIEKISGIVEYSSQAKLYLSSPWQIFTEFSNVSLPDNNLHRFIGEAVFGTSAGIPPTLLGEVVLFLGAFWVIPIVFLITLLIRYVEKRANRQLKSPITTMISVIILSKAYYFFLNSDAASFLVRAIYDLVLLAIALFIYLLVEKFTKKNMHRAFVS